MLVLLAVLATQIGSGDPAPQPTAEETLALELVNRMRVDPAGEVDRLLAERPRAAYQGFDPAMFRAELSAMPAVAPLVFHSRLIAAGRNHSAYTERHREFGHGETAGREGYTGDTGMARARLAGYPEAHGVVFENAGSFVVGGAYGCHWGCAVDDGPGGPGGMQARRGHRKTMMDARWREFGTGFVVHADGRVENSALFGEGAGHRLVGGVAFVDLDGDGFYDVGEGVGGVRITLGDEASTTSWASGAYTLDPGRAKARKRARWTARLYDVEISADLSSGEANLKLDADWLGPIQSRWEELREDLAKRRGVSRERALHDLAFWSAAMPQVAGDAPLPDEVSSLRSDWAAFRDRVVEDLIRGAAEQHGEGDALPRGSLAAAWTEQARQIQELDKERSRLEDSRSSDATRRRQVRQLARKLEALRQTVTMPRLLAPLDAVRARLDGLSD